MPEQPIDDRIAFLIIRYRGTGPMVEGGINPFYLSLPQERKDKVVESIVKSATVLALQLLGDETRLEEFTKDLKRFAKVEGPPPRDIPGPRPV